jgi:protein required for attachment to host cells
MMARKKEAAMIIPHNALVLVADGKKYLLLRNTGDLNRPELTFEGGGDKENPATSAQGSDQPGRAFATSGTARSAMDQTDWHQIEEDRFAARIAEMLGRLAEAGDFGELVVVAPPKCLASLRESFEKPVTSRIIAEVDKDLTKHPVAEITEILGREES